MPYVKRTVMAGNVRETRRMYTGRVHTNGIKREPHKGETCEAQKRCNERHQEEVLRWRLNANFSAGDTHLVLHYYDKTVTLEKAEADKKEFLRLLRRECKKQKIPWKYVACTETKRMTNVHHHIILPEIKTAVLFDVWEQVVGKDGGNISIKPLDHRGNHAKLANYLIKESRSTVNRHKEDGKRYKRFSCAQGMEMPEPEYEVVQANGWKEPKGSKGFQFLKDENGMVTRQGVHEVTGWPWQEYTEIWVGDGDPPKKKKRGKRHE